MEDTFASVGNRESVARMTTRFDLLDLKLPDQTGYFP